MLRSLRLASLILAFVFTFSLAGTAHAKDRSSRTNAGIALVVVGGVFAAASLACGALVANAYASGAREPDLAGSVYGYPSLATGVVGGVLLGVGIPTLVRGLKEDRQSSTALVIEPSPTGLRLRW